jgi:hypothetical protein
MNRIIVSDPSDIFFPLPREVFDESSVVYHGTGAINAQDIETNGWRTGKLPYEWSDVLKVLKWCEQLRLEFSDTENGYAVLRAFSAGMESGTLGDLKFTTLVVDIGFAVKWTLSEGGRFTYQFFTLDLGAEQNKNTVQSVKLTFKKPDKPIKP